MVDFQKAVLWGVQPNQIQQHPSLRFTSILDESTGMVSAWKQAKYKGLLFKIDSKTVRLEGSLHKYWNSGKHNYNDFTFEKLQAVVSELSDLFDFDPEQARLENLEVGANIETPFPVNDLLEHLLIHRQEKFKDVFVRSGNYKKAFHDRYNLKVYNKGEQYGLEYDLMRFEIQYRKMKDIEKFGVTSWADLIDSQKLLCLGNELLKKWNEVLLFEWSLNPEKLSHLILKRDYYQWQLTEYWLGLDKNNRNKRRRKYLNTVEKHGKNNHLVVAELLESKYSELLKSGDLFTGGSK